tara:strand:- start:10699 stop:11565 length:867 start_codon:yes stop_codon:yes gene_type:complete
MRKIKILYRKLFSSKLIWLRKYIEKKSNEIWYDYPFGEKPIGSKSEYLKLAEDVSKKTYLEINHFEQKSGFIIDKNWLDDLALHTQVVIKDSPLCYGHGRILYSALCNYIKKNQIENISIPSINIWETGTARGFSAICMAKALAELEQPGKIVTFDVLPHNKKMFWNCIDDLEGPKTRSELLYKWKDLVSDYIFFHQGDTIIELPKVKVERIHFAFLDGAHTYDDVMFEFLEISNKQLPGDMIIYDDYTPNQFSGLVKAVDEICEKFRYNTKIINAHDDRGYLIATKI